MVISTFWSARIAAIGCLAVAVAGLAFAGEVIRVENSIPGQYIVVLEEDAGLSKGSPGVAQLAAELAISARGEVGEVYDGGLSGFVLLGSDEAARNAASDSRVSYVIEDAWVESAGVQADPPSWGLDRVDQLPPALDAKYVYYGDGGGAHLYVLDSGVRSTHADLAGRVDTTNAFTAVNDGLGSEDCSGHGTFVAAVAAGSSFGVAKGATIHPVRVTGCDGFGTVSALISGIQWVTSHHLSPAVANVSLQAPAHQALDDAVQASINAGVTYVVAAGNGGVAACDVSPARVYAALTVGASDATDARAYYSNFGYCVDLFAPGDQIVSAWAASDVDWVTMSGTSAAAPHVAGVVALYLGDQPSALPAEVGWAILNAATSAVPDDGTGSTDLLAYSAFVGAGVDQPPFPALTISCRNRRCSFDASGSTDDGRVTRYGWEFGDGTSAMNRTKPTIAHAFPSAGCVFQVTQYVTDNAGQTSTLGRELRFCW